MAVQATHYSLEQDGGFDATIILAERKCLMSHSRVMRQNNNKVVKKWFDEIIIFSLNFVRNETQTVLYYGCSYIISDKGK